jgi:hypothetical protein
MFQSADYGKLASIAAATDYLAVRLGAAADNSHSGSALGKFVADGESFPSRVPPRCAAPLPSRNFAGKKSAQKMRRTSVKTTGGTTAQEHTGINRWLELIQAEYREMPDLRLSKPQMQRLWGFDPLYMRRAGRRARGSRCVETNAERQLCDRQGRELATASGWPKSTPTALGLAILS